MLIDSHVHIVSDNEARYPLNPARIQPAGVSQTWYREAPVTTEGLLGLMAAAGVDRAMVVQPMTAYQYDNSYAADSVQAASSRLVGVAIVDEEGPDAPERLSYWVDRRGMRGVRLFATVEGKTLDLGSPAVEALLTQADALGIPVCVQTNLSAVPQLRWMVKRFPRLPIVLDHMAASHIGKGLAPELIADLESLAPYANAHLKLTTLNFDAVTRTQGDMAEFLRWLVGLFGARRIMWGSNFPATSDRPYATLVDTARDVLAFLPEEDRSWILGGKAATLWPELG